MTAFAVCNVRAQVTAHPLQAAYGDQFTKLLRLVRTAIVPKLAPKAVVPHLLDAWLDSVAQAKWHISAQHEGLRANVLKDARRWGATA